MRRRSWTFVISILLAAAGFLFYWPLAALGILLAALSSHAALAIVLGILLDVAYGAPPAHLHFFLFPFTLVAILAVVTRRLLGAYVREKGRGDRL